MSSLGQILVKAFIIEIDEDVLLLVGYECDEFFDTFGERLLFAVVVIGEVGMEVKGLLFL